MKVTPSTRWATRADVMNLARATGRLDQLKVLQKGLPLTRANIRKAGG
jgi:hypothetical protein